MSEALDDMTLDEMQRQKEQLEARLNNEFVAFPIMKKDRPIGCMENTSALLRHFGVSAKYNEMSKTVEVIVPNKLHKDKVLNDSIVIVRDLARKQGYDPGVAEENLGPISGVNAYHPVRDWVLSKPWDGADRIELLLKTVETTEDEAFKRMLLTKWLISAIALIMYDTSAQNADHKAQGFLGVEGILVFKGKQGLGKTQWIESLVPPRSHWVKDAVTLDPHNKDSVLLAVGHWIVELGEIDATFKKSDIAALKGFATQKVDVLRPPYAKKADHYLRRTAFTGTVNDSTFLAETNEHRRWWVLGVTSVNPKHAIDIQQMWAQVYTLYQQCTPYWLEPDERERLYANNQQYERGDPLLEMLEQFVKKPITDRTDPGYAEQRDKVQRAGAGEIVEYMLRKGPSKPEMNTASKWLQDNGFHRDAATKKFTVFIDHVELKNYVNGFYNPVRSASLYGINTD